MYFIISENTVNKIIELCKDVPYNKVMPLLNEIKAIPVPQQNLQDKTETIINNKQER